MIYDKVSIPNKKMFHICLQNIILNGFYNFLNKIMTNNYTFSNRIIHNKKNAVILDLFFFGRHV